MKYARAIPVHEIDASEDIRIIDVIDLDAYRDAGGNMSFYTNDDEFLARIFSPQLVSEWKAAGQWFVPVPCGVQAGARFTGTDYNDPAAYLNPDGSDGNGPQPPPVAP